MTNKITTDNGCIAEMVQHSQTVHGKEIMTFSVKYWLGIHAEFLRHRQLSRGVKSNRAIPCKTIRAEVLSDPYVPIWFGRNQSGMVAKKEVRFPRLARMLWRGARYPAVAAHWIGEKVFGGHKEWLNRLLNPWQWVRETITATEWDNLYNLRIHDSAQNDIRDIVTAMRQVHLQSEAVTLNAGEYHAPYVDRNRDPETGVMIYSDSDGTPLSTEDAIKCSAARCARSSYDNHDKTSPLLHGDPRNPKDFGDAGLYQMLIEDDPKHSSPIEHQALPMEVSTCFRIDQLEEGETHIDHNGNKWSGNLKGWVQNRQMIPNHDCNKYVPH